MKITNKTLALSTVLLLTLALAAGGIGLVSAHPPGSDSPEGDANRGGRLIELIGEEAALELRDTVEVMREEGASFEEIRDYVNSYLDDLGFELLPPKGDGSHNGNGMRLERLLGEESPIIDQIGEETLQELRDTVEAMREAGSSHEEIHTYVVSYLDELGVELPEPQGKGPQGRKGMKHDRLFGEKSPLIDQIGEETLQELRDTVQAMRDAEASHEEIREYIHDSLEELGVELPEPKGDGAHLGKGMGRRGFMGGRGRPNEKPQPPQEDPEEATVPTGSA